MCFVLTPGNEISIVRVEKFICPCFDFKEEKHGERFQKQQRTLGDSCRIHFGGGRFGNRSGEYLAVPVHDG